MKQRKTGGLKKIGIRKSTSVDSIVTGHFCVYLRSSWLVVVILQVPYFTTAFPYSTPSLSSFHQTTSFHIPCLPPRLPLSSYARFPSPPSHSQIFRPMNCIDGDGQPLMLAPLPDILLCPGSSAGPGEQLGRGGEALPLSYWLCGSCGGRGETVSCGSACSRRRRP